MVHIREVVVREIMRSIVPMGETGDFVVTLINTLRIKTALFVDNAYSFEYHNS